MSLRNITVSSRQLDLEGVDRDRPYVFTRREVEGAPWSHPAGRDYKSRVYFGPTVFDLISSADESVDVTRDHHHIYLEGYEVVGDQSPAGKGDIDQPGEIHIQFGS